MMRRRPFSFFFFTSNSNNLEQHSTQVSRFRHLRDCSDHTVSLRSEAWNFSRNRDLPFLCSFWTHCLFFSYFLFRSALFKCHLQRQKRGRPEPDEAIGRTSLWNSRQSFRQIFFNYYIFFSFYTRFTISMIQRQMTASRASKTVTAKLDKVPEDIHLAIIRFIQSWKKADGSQEERKQGKRSVSLNQHVTNANSFVFCRCTLLAELRLPILFFFS